MLLQNLWDGVEYGWWQDVDEDSLLPIVVIQRVSFNEWAQWSHIWHSVGKFKSIKEAKRAGWNIPLTKETKRIGTYIVRVE